MPLLSGANQFISYIFECMNKLIVFIGIIVFCCGHKLSAQTNTKDTLSKYFVVLYTHGEAWDTTKQFYDQKYFDEHSKFLSSLRKDKVIVTGGRYADTGMIIIQSKDEITAHLLMEGDISVKNKLFRFELFELDVFYGGCLSTSD